MLITRPFLLAALTFVAFLLWQAWDQDYGAKSPPIQAAAETAATTQSPGAVPPAAAAGADIPHADIPQAAGTPPATAPAPSSATPVAPSARIEVHTDLLRLTIDTRGGALIQADLLDYPKDPKDKTHPVRLLDDAAATYFVAQTGLVSATSPAPDHQAIFSADKTSYTLAPGSDKLEVPLTWQDASGFKVRKVYVFTRGSYLIETREEIDNSGTTAWSGNEYRQLQRVPPVIASSGFSFNNPEKYAFAGGAWYSPQDKFKKLAFDKFAETPLKADFAGGWAAMLQHYFFAAWIPAKDETDAYSTQIVESPGLAPRYLIRSFSPVITVAPGQNHTIASHLYVGPTLDSQLAAIDAAGIAHGLNLTADYGMLTAIAEPLHWILVELHSFVGNWGLAIILLVLLIKLALFKLSEAQYRSMAKMKRLQPRMQALKERYGDDKQKLSAATMELYQKEKINPLGGCLPTLITDSGVLRAVLRVARKRRTAPGTLLRLDPEPVRAGSVLHPADPQRADHARRAVAVAGEPGHGSNAAAHDENDAADLCGDVPVLPRRAGAVLRRERRLVAAAAMDHHAAHGSFAKTCLTG